MFNFVKNEIQDKASSGCIGKIEITLNIPLIHLLVLAMKHDVKTDTDLITRWLNEELILKADACDAQTLITELHHLYQIFPLCYQEFKIEADALKSWLDFNYSNFISQSTDSQNTPLEQLRLKNIVDRPLVAFLAIHSEDSQITTIRSVYLFLCLKLVILTKHDSRINQTLTECRLLESKNRSFLIPFLPNFSSIRTVSDLFSYFQSLKDANLYEQWKQINKNELEGFISNARANPHKDEKNLEWTDSDLCHHRLAKFLYQFSYPLDLISERKKGVKKTRKQQEKIVASSLYEDEITGNSISTLSFITEIDNECFEVLERQDDEKYDIEQVFISHPINYYIDKVNADQQANSRRLRAMSQVTDVNTAHLDEVLVLIDSLIHTLEQIDSREIEDVVLNDNNKKISFTICHQAALYLFILLLTGNDEILSSDRIEISFNALRYKIIFKPTRSEIQDDWDSQLCAKNMEYLYGYLSKNINYLYAILFESVDSKTLSLIENKAHEQLKQLNKDKGTRLSLNKVKNYLAHYLTQKGYDHAIVSVLTNKPIHSVSALPYFNASQLEIYMCQKEFYNHLYNEFINSKRFRTVKEDRLYNFLRIPEDKEIDYWNKQTGTALAITEFTLEKIISSLKTDLVGAIKCRSLMQLDSVVTLHNLFTDYLYLMLAVSTGYRPVTEPFGRLQHVDTRTSKYFISDKENHLDSIGRFIYLPKIATDQIIAFCQYLNRYVKAYGRINYAVSQIFNDIFTSKTGLITYLKYDPNNNSVYKEKINNTYLAKRLAAFISLPLNWSRHFIRSYKNIYLSAYSPYLGDGDDLFGYDVVGAFMGHADELGYSFLGKFSGLKSKELRLLSCKLNELLETCGFEVVHPGDLHGTY